MNVGAIRILGLDPGLRKTGWGIISLEGARLSHIGHGVIAPNDKLGLAERLLVLFEGITKVIETHAPDEAAVEETFMTANGSSTLKLGQARACALGKRFRPALDRRGRPMAADSPVFRVHFVR